MKSQLLIYSELIILLIPFFNLTFSVQSTNISSMTYFPSNGWPQKDPEDLGF
jgi:hypothetical protein